MFGAGLDGIDPAPLALVEIGRRQEIADRENAGQRRADLVRERGERRLDHAGATVCQRFAGSLWRSLLAALRALPAATLDARFFGGRFFSGR